MTFGRTAWLMARHFARDVIASRRTLVLSGFLLLAAVIFGVAGLAMGEDTGDRLGLYFLFLYTCVAGIGLQFACQAYGLAATSDEIESGAAVYLFTRPLPRPAILAGRLLAAWAVVSLAFVVLALPVSFALLGARGLSAFLPTAAIVVAAAGCYVCVFALLGLLTRHALLAGLLFVVFWEQPISMLPVAVKSLSIKYHLLCAVRAWVTAPFGQPFPGDEMVEQCEGGGTAALVTVAVVAVVMAGLALQRMRKVEILRSSG
jgi:ABC-2 type transport system permease protein